ncbi:hypothetical protein NPS01_31270 [Nocardioides psychrotolerans]|uniref:Camelysin metallo-endopeptidase n=1 Tax=Nocardioides psychrotolerans TaxID=1005945 RepID=A0A1I3MDR3_9ACTN|nr:hypothetical protein [Nocardioides psychrotolerans]GEP39464.1 hypothetical protein NPS01_31270 [Nocardioides psychrotolerans]SFI95087.1 hypothetical protein SAMN05216561_11558 [Nocardioides psychrotolerans]
MKIAITRKLLLAVASVLMVAAVAALSGVPWSQASGSEAGVELVAEDSLATLTVTGIQPGDSVVRSATIRNSTNASVRVAFTEQGAPSTAQDGLLLLRIESEGRQVFAGGFGAMADLTQDAGELAPGASATFRFTVALPDDASYNPPGQEVAQATYAWVLVPVTT